MDSEEISLVLRKEKNSQALKAIPSDFYQEAKQCILELEGEIRKINNPRSPESKLLENELERAITDLETIFEKRVGKVIITATYQSCAHSSKVISKDIEKMLPTEKRLYELVLSGIEDTKRELIYPITNPDACKPEGQARSGENPTQGAIGKGSMKSSAGKGLGKNNINEEYVVVRILKDLPTFAGADGRDYTLCAEDVVVLPQMNANGLVKRNAARIIAGKA